MKKEKKEKKKIEKKTEKEEKTVRPSEAKEPSYRRGRYDFSKNYPKTAGDGSFFPTKIPQEKMSRRAKLLTLFAAILVFLLSYILFSTAQELSNRPPVFSQATTEYTTVPIEAFTQ